MAGTSRTRRAELTAGGLVGCRGHTFLRLLRRAGLLTGSAAPGSDGACALAASLSKRPAQKPAEMTEPRGDAPTGESPVMLPLAAGPRNPVNNKESNGEKAVLLHAARLPSLAGSSGSRKPSVISSCL